MSVNIKGYLRNPIRESPQKFIAWEIESLVVTHEAVLERLIDDITKEAERVFGAYNIKSRLPVLLLITSLDKPEEVPVAPEDLLDQPAEMNSDSDPPPDRAA